jgi:hypothetical protein
LESGKLGHKRFDFAHWNQADDGNRQYDGCGTSGCAIGECPILFPKSWEFSDGLPVLKGITRVEYATPVTKSARSFFGLEYRQFQHLFLPNSQEVEEFGGKKLGDNARRKSVARNIREFVARQR